jgi:ribosomal protein S27AE
MELNAAQLDIELKNLNGTSDQQFCPECGAVMVEADRIKEGQAVYVWYDCSKAECSGSWLKKL